MEAHRPASPPSIPRSSRPHAPRPTPMPMMTPPASLLAPKLTIWSPSAPIAASSSIHHLLSLLTLASLILLSYLLYVDGYYYYICQSPFILYGSSTLLVLARHWIYVTQDGIMGRYIVLY
ncbi:hypothetical protein glysoja_028685 [Glycine soja]|uniref:Uncharacterized protein n=1 Tax=Glycine soja TaxID=3848 RepID=A0A0B2NXE1_GLYSO|nr:hypothetical protein glysoja_028685 [Glycine soja]